VCDEQTYGVFNPAKDIIKKIKDQEKKAEERNTVDNEIGDAGDGDD